MKMWFAWIYFLHVILFVHIDLTIYLSITTILYAHDDCKASKDGETLDVQT